MWKSPPACPSRGIADPGLLGQDNDLKIAKSLIFGSHGRVLAAAALTGLRTGIPVVASLNDVTASVLVIGGHAQGAAAIVSGTYSINETVSRAPKTGPRWFCRNDQQLGELNNIAISPASAANCDWFLGSSLIDYQSQNRTVAARVMAKMKTFGHLSQRGTVRRQSICRPNMISIRLRPFWRLLSSWTTVPRDV